MTPLDLFLASCFAGFSVILFIVSVVAYRRYRETRLGIVAAAFFIFVAMSVLALISGFLSMSEFEMSSTMVALSIGVLLCLYLAMLKR